MARGSWLVDVMVSALVPRRRRFTVATVRIVCFVLRFSTSGVSVAAGLRGGVRRVAVCAVVMVKVMTARAHVMVLGAHVLPESEAANSAIRGPQGYGTSPAPT